MRNFRMRCLYRPAAEPIVLDPYEVELAISACLYSLAMHYDTLDDRGYANYAEDAIKDMLAGAAPNLSKVDLFWEFSGSSPCFVQALRGPSHRYQRGSLPSSSTSMGFLRHLNIVARDSALALKEWSTVTDFPKLEHLELHNYLEVDALLWLSSCQLSKLKILTLNLGLGDVCESVTAALNQLSLGLSLLEAFKISGPYESSTIDTVLENHGVRLRRLLLPRPSMVPDGHLSANTAGFTSVEFMHKIHRDCPQIEELGLCLLRSQGDVNEVAVYRALGTIPSLRKLHLSLYSRQAFTFSSESCRQFHNPRGIEKVMSQEESTQLGGALIDFAVDANLARSIFHTISAAKPAISQPLECLTLSVDGAKECGGFGASHLTDVLSYIGRSWYCTRNTRDDKLHECFVTERDPEEKLDREWMDEHDKDPMLEGVVFAQSVRRLWPAAKTKDWKKVWHSFEIDLS
ncbi:hypothetical protein AUEXF2481DRAFT_210415 [Aureobasidium subglaciale EXF-2481]|uniref:F-box domain-containing protein n=1 Tax=Aureobasidium subglaciale (strain EXF-2481) TaxID=1043005 RepID=A0A074YBS5_AURSE|nr:uncharacterized protein AUEXF2481DRAFT_210415 [Aureobasidium subglaciale EXF-2481]KEQ95238.1 hypothetical protein AUEXF2481DRAFT_210415 [Aureobasidium subglaciale EXF-2481]